ncbi:MAG: SGNH/GDSL hydrolase family protein [Armatimonadetes bacterium]|nr:SGNH/GDSL hydrolase family protein [Armatimonadota bacterium]MCX7967481.1 SGNH/GDSL hydrolase family protein [Armatimonadota bacterium]MDW8144449.1 SGNH/GDSL hydrolase family protein [Armatimonadota bacterium]
MAFKLQDGQKVVFIGDSITDCGRRDVAPPLGNGYVKFVADLISIRYPSLSVTIVNKGISGNTVADLRERWHDDVLVLKPDWVSVLIGINDVHRTLRNEPTAVPPERYEQLYRECLTLAKERAGAQLVLMEPFYISTDTETNSWRTQVLRALDDYRKIVRKLACEFDAIFVPLHDLFQEQLRYRPADMFCPEPVHPNNVGHLLIAHAWLTAMGW